MDNQFTVKTSQNLHPSKICMYMVQHALEMWGNFEYFLQ